MICESCKDKCHEECRGGSWCDCQHQPPAPAAAESDLDWPRQG
ncbi:hypothetical protein [Nonomuraea rhizosphaerae]|nr:hypothetical protein [Nonomuraea rhizosphaerae]